MLTYSLDTFHPTHLRCDLCGYGLPASPPADVDPEELRTLTEDEPVLVWPRLAGDLQLHGMLGPGEWFPAEKGGRRSRQSGDDRGYNDTPRAAVLPRPGRVHEVR